MDKMAAADSFQDTLGQAVALDQARENRQGRKIPAGEKHYLTEHGNVYQLSSSFPPRKTGYSGLNLNDNNEPKG